MKYIRTKDGKILPTLWQDTSTAIKEANTIEELCDEFVVIAKDFPKYRNSIYPAYSHYDYVKNAKTDEVVKEIYGAIWTNKGLIYVAKMNDKGVLELL